jgi:hypothetical protein
MGGRNGPVKVSGQHLAGAFFADVRHLRETTPPEKIGAVQEKVSFFSEGVENGCFALGTGRQKGGELHQGLQLVLHLRRTSPWRCAEHRWLKEKGRLVMGLLGLIFFEAV